jgi:hypothetical protein
MDTRAFRFIAVGIVIALAIGGKVSAGRGSDSDPHQHKLTAEARAASLTFGPTVDPSDQQWIRAAIAQARPEAQALIAAIDGLVTIDTVSEPGAPWVGLAQEGTDDIRLNVAYLDGERKQDRPTAVLHELGHVIDFELIPDEQMRQLAGAIPAGGGGCLTAETGDCTVPEERFADTFAKWALRGSVSVIGAGYGVMSPASLESWGQPLGLIAAQLSVSG